MTGVLPLSKAGVMVALVLLLIAGMAAQTWRVVSLERKLTTAELAPEKAAADTARVHVDTVRVHLAAIHDTVTRRLRDTLWRTGIVTTPPVTHEDTVRSVVQLPIVVAKYDSLQRTCSSFVISCDEFRSAAERRFAADSTYARGLEVALRHEQPGRLAAMWNRIKMPVAFTSGLYLGLHAK